MRTVHDPASSRAAAVVFGLLDPIPYGHFVAALIFDAIYFRTGDILWNKASAWLITFGLLFAVIPRLVNLAHVWITGPRPRWRGAVLSFWLNAAAIVAAIVNAFVHSRDAYATMPDGLWLSIVTVALIAIAHIVDAVHAPSTRSE